jgi:hypothetical protein
MSLSIVGWTPDGRLCRTIGNPNAVWTEFPPNGVIIRAYIKVMVYKVCCPHSPYGLMCMCLHVSVMNVSCGVLVGKCVPVCVTLRLLHVSMSAWASAQEPAAFPLALMCDSSTCSVLLCVCTDLYRVVYALTCIHHWDAG